MEARPLTQNTDRDLAEDVLARGDTAAFRELYRRHTPRLLGFVTRLLGRPTPESEDVVQECWIRACTSLERFRWDSTLGTWLLAIALNVVRDHLRRNARSHDVTVAEMPDRPGPIVALDDRIDLERAIAMVPDDFRLVLVLHDVEGMKHKEIAAQLDIAPGTSKSRLFSARRQVRAALAKGDRQ